MDIVIIILGILKVIGFILLSILLIAIILIIIIFFAPIKYSIYGDKNENNDIIAQIDASMFFKSLSCYYYYTSKGNIFYVKLFGFKIVGNNKKKVSNDDDLQKEFTEDKKIGIKSNKVDSQVEKEPSHTLNHETEELQESISIIEKAKLFFNRVEIFKDKIIYFYNYPKRNEIQKLTIDLVLEIINKIKPKYFKLDAEVGFESPDTTGYLMAVSSVIIFNGIDMNLKGNFEKKIFIFNIMSNGKFNLWSILWPMGKYIIKRPIRKLIKELI